MVLLNLVILVRKLLLLWIWIWEDASAQEGVHFTFGQCDIRQYKEGADTKQETA